MKKKLKIKLTLLLIAVGFSVLAQKEGLESISENDLKAHLEFVASDFMQGRDFTTTIPGLEITAEYLKSQSKRLGLVPGGEDYFQKVEMISARPDTNNTVLQLQNQSGEVIYTDKEIFSMDNALDSDTVAGNIIFSGYGWYNSDTKYNDSEGLELKDKIVLVMTRNLEKVKEGEKPDMTTEMRKVQKAVLGGAKAILFVPDPLSPNPDYFESIKKYAEGGILRLKEVKTNPMRIKILFGTENLANQILKSSGKTLAQIQNEINETEKPKSFDIEELSGTVFLPKIVSEISGKNIVAVLEGSDPVLKKECVLVTAHYDHLGVESSGEVYNGADDNGSGIVSLLEIAEAFQKMKKKPKRSIVFVWVTAEEKGLIGSDYYSQHPAFPLENTLVDINLDMVGRSAETEPDDSIAIDKRLAGPNGLYIVSGKQSAELTKISSDICDDLGLLPSDDLSDAFLNRSDYFHFYKHGIPVLGLSTGLHEDYHQVTDELDKIDYFKMKRVAQYAFLVAYKVANQKNRIVVDNPRN